MNMNLTNNSQASVAMFNDKMILSSSKNQKEILLWAENSGTVAFQYTDENMRQFIPRGFLRVLDYQMYSEYFIYLQYNKNLFNVYKTDQSKFYSKFSVSQGKVTCFDVSENSAEIAVGTENGEIVLYNLMVGKLLAINNIGKHILHLLFYKDTVLALDKDKLGCYLLGDLISPGNAHQELKVFYNTDFYTEFIIYKKLIYLYNNKKIVLLDIDNFTPTKMFVIGNVNVFNLKLGQGEDNVYFTDLKSQIYFFDPEKYPNNDTHNLAMGKEQTILIQPDLKTPLGNISTYEFGKYGLLTGHEDGKICFWNKKTKNSPIYSFVSLYNIHKGEVTNILLINKPISQYGLNYNKKISECFVADTQIKELKEVRVKANSEYENFVENYIDNFNTEIMNECTVEELDREEESGQEKKPVGKSKKSRK